MREGRGVYIHSTDKYIPPVMYKEGGADNTTRARVQDMWCMWCGECMVVGGWEEVVLGLGGLSMI